MSIEPSSEAGGTAVEEDLACRLKNRDPQALAVVFSLYGRDLASLIFLIVRDRGVAEDLTQEAFLRAWIRSDQFKPEQGSLRGWLLVIARNCALDYRKSRQARVFGHSLNRDIRYRVLSAEGSLLDSERTERLKMAFGRLKPSEKQVIELAYYQELSQKEIAERMHRPLGTIKSWTRSALNQLRMKLAAASPK